MKNWYFIFLLLLLVTSCDSPESKSLESSTLPTGPYLTVLGIAQDAGFPQINCRKDCCKNLWEDKSQRKMVSCLGVVNPKANSSYIFDATPDFKDQLDILQQNHTSQLKGVFLTHAHIGHYTGLMHLGREAMGAKEVPVHAMPTMANFLTSNGPWSQLVALKNIVLHPLANDSTISIYDQISVTPLQVPHRDEFSETVGYQIKGPNKTALFIPDIDKWEKWDRDILSIIHQVDYAFLDGSFFENGEIPGRDMSLIPHPFIEESMALFHSLSAEDKAKVYFIHFNHTNPILQNGSNAQKKVIANGFNIAKEGQVVEL